MCYQRRYGEANKQIGGGNERQFKTVNTVHRTADLAGEDAEGVENREIITTILSAIHFEWKSGTLAVGCCAFRQPRMRLDELLCSLSLSPKNNTFKCIIENRTKNESFETFLDFQERDLVVSTA